MIRTAYGTGIEKVNLMTNLLRVAGIKAVPAAAYSIPSETDNCGLNAIREFVILAEADGRPYRLSVQNADPAATDCTFLVDLAEGKKSLPDPPIASIGYQASIVITPQQEADMDIKATLNNLLIPYTSNYAGTLLPGIREYTVTPGEKTTTISGKGKAGLKQEENYYFFYLPTHIFPPSALIPYSFCNFLNSAFSKSSVSSVTYSLILSAHVSLLTAGSAHISLICVNFNSSDSPSSFIP